MRHPKSGYVSDKVADDLYYVRAVPKNARAAIGKTKWSIPLGTANRVKALQLARALAVQHDAEIEAALRPEPFTLLSADEQREVIERGGLDGYRKWLADLKRQADHLTHRAEGYQELAALDPQPGPGPDHEDFEPPVDPVWARGRAVALHAEAQQNRVDLAAGVAIIAKVEEPSPKRNASALREFLADEALAAEPITFTELCEKYLSVRKPRYQGSYRNVAKAFEKIAGRMLLKDITKKHVRAYRDSLPSAGYMETTAKGCFKKLKTMFRFGVEDDYLQQNPADTLPWAWPFVQSLAEAEDTARRTFSHEEAGRYLKAAASLPATNRTRWLILLMMFTGARGEEIAQMSPSDVTNIGGIWCLSFHDRDWRKLKNSGSRRTVPIHNQVLDQGFLDFVESRKGRQLLFSDRHAVNKTNCYKRNAGDIYKLLRKSALVTDSRVVPYSSRHTVTDCLRLIETPKYIEDRILGHKTAENKVSYEYGEDQIHVLKKWIDQIDPLDQRRNTTAFKEDDD